MFTAEMIQARLREKPFRPLRIIATEGLRFDIYHPDLVWVGRHDLQVGFASPESPMVYERTMRLAMVRIVGLEDLPQSNTTPLSGLQGYVLCGKNG